MALFEDKRKPVNIYEKGTPTEQAQSKMNAATGRVFQAAANTADNYAGGAGTRAIASPVIEGRQNQRQFFANKAMNANRTMPEMRQANTALYAGGKRVVGGNSEPPVLTQDQTFNPHGKTTNVVKPQRPAPGQMQMMSAHRSPQMSSPGQPTVSTMGYKGADRFEVNMSDRDRAIKGSLQAIDAKVASGFQPTPEQVKRIMDLKRQAGFSRGGTDRYDVGPDGRPINQSANVSGNSFKRGNLDIEFDSSVSPEARQRFLAAPVRPTAQIDRYNEQRRARSFGPTQGQMASINADQIINPRKQSSNGLLTKENAPDMSGQQRGRLNAQILANQQSGRNTEAELANRFEIAKGKNAIEAENVRGANREREANIEEKNVETSQKKLVASLREQYANETDPARKKMLERQLYALGAKQPPKAQIITEQSVDKENNKLQRNYIVDERGNARPVVGEGGVAGLESLPQGASDREVGKHYITMDGRVVVWDGKGLKIYRPAQQTTDAL